VLKRVNSIRFAAPTNLMRIHKRFSAHPAWLAAALLSAAFTLAIFFNYRSDIEISQAEVIRKAVYYHFQIKNTTNQPVANAHFFVHVPLLQTATQRCEIVQSPYPHEIMSDPLGNRMLKIKITTFPPFAIKTVPIQALLQLGVSPMRMGEPQLRPSAMHQHPSGAENMAIRKLAHRLQSESICDTTHNLYRWVAGNIDYSGYSRDPQGAVRTLINRRGDCTDFADLFVALARELDIPARRVSGYLSPDSGVLKSVNYHDWAEFYDDGVWRLADAQQRNFDTNYHHYVAMRIDDFVSYDGKSAGFHRFYVDTDGLIAKMDS